ncbi:MAG: efflux RND transporter periplasmic adaptor subunit [Bryobacteraceae bacterium]
MKLGISCVLLSITLLAGCSREQKKAEASAKAPEPLSVRTATAETRAVEKTISVTGALHPDEVASVSSEIAGRVAAIHVDFGHSVRKGQVVAELDKQEVSLRLERSKAALAQALAQLGLRPDEANQRPESTPAIRQATAQMEDARSKYESAQRLVKTGDIAQERFTEVEKAYQARQAALQAARNEALTQLANVQALQAEVKLAQKNLSDATIRAPFDGAVSEKLVSPGQFLKENTPILTIVKTQPMRLRLDVTETAAAVVKVGTPLTFRTDAIPGETFRAVVREINPSLDAQSRSLSAEARITRGDPRLRPGMFVQVDLITARDQEVTVVPKQALHNVAGLTKIFLVRDGKVVEQRINPGQEIGGWVEVPREQVSPGDQVAVSNLGQLVHGLSVRTTKETARCTRCDGAERLQG